MKTRKMILLATALAATTWVALAGTGDDIIKAAYHGKVEQLQTLLKQDFDPDTRDSYGGTALHAAMFQDNVKIVKMLLSAGFDPNAIGPKNGYTPLHDAVWANNIEAAKLLLAVGAKTDIKGLDGHTPLEKARNENKTDLVELLESVK